MAGVSPIEWTERTWNPIVGCALKSPGCTNCYAMGMAARLEHMGVAHYAGLTQATKAGPVWTGEFRTAPDHVLADPLRRRKPTTWFVNSMSDLFGDGVTDAMIDRVFAVMLLCRQHTFQILTKRPDRMRAYLADPGTDASAARFKAIHAAIAELAPDFPGLSDLWFMPHIWLGFSAEDQRRFDERWAEFSFITGFGPKFVSLEPLLSWIDLQFREDHCDLCGGTGILARWPKGSCHVCNGKGRVVINGAPRSDGYHRLDWVIVGGESGRDARPMDPAWARSLRDQCVAAGTPFFFKQWGEWAEAEKPVDWPTDRDYHRTHFWDRRPCARPIEGDWSAKYRDGAGAYPPPPFDIFKTPEYLDQVSRCGQADCREAGKCTGNSAFRASIRLGKKAAGRELDGRTWDQRPEVQS